MYGTWIAIAIAMAMADIGLPTLSIYSISDLDSMAWHGMGRALMGWDGIGRSRIGWVKMLQCNQAIHSLCSMLTMMLT